MSLISGKYNLHTHSFYCGHGSGRIEDYVAKAEEEGLEILGFSDHLPFPDNFLHRSRMDYSRIGDYERDVNEAKKTSRMTILLGYECDYFPQYHDYFTELYESGRVDYLITGTHFILHPDGRRTSPFGGNLEKDDLYLYRDQMFAAIDTGIFSFIAHPDLYMAGYLEWDDTAKAIGREIIEKAMDKGMPLEINANGFPRPLVNNRTAYPFGPFWDLAKEMGAMAIMNTDAHTVEDLVKNRGRLISFAKEHGAHLIQPIVKDSKLEWSRA